MRFQIDSQCFQFANTGFYIGYFPRQECIAFNSGFIFCHHFIANAGMLIKADFQSIDGSFLGVHIHFGNSMYGLQRM